MKKKELIKINRAKLAPKLTLAILLITVITGFAYTYATAKETQSSTMLIFNATEWLDSNAPPVPPPTIIYIEDGVFHIKDFWSSHLLGGAIGNDAITGYTISLFHFKQDLATGNIVLNGQTWFYFTWGDLTGYFTGTVNVKMVNGVIDGKFTLQGFEDFGGMKLFGTVCNIDSKTNGLYGTILIPN